MFKIFEWNEDFVTGYEEVDKEHKQLFDDINELYVFLSDTKKYNAKIPEKIEKIESVMVEHLDIENNLLKKYKIAGYEEHINAHNKIKEAVTEIKNYNLPVIMAAIMMLDIIIQYFLDHFRKYDKDFLSELKNK